MKNEERIVELLAESLRVQDRHSELLVQQGKLLEKVVEHQERAEKQQKEVSERIIASVDALADIVKVWMERTKKLDDHEDRLQKLERKG